jgi:beta-lactamase superfamily II metal-dependent hydrolase
MRTRLLLSAFFILSSTLAPCETLPPWSEGRLDIHHINTGRGESTLFILPDGTTLLVDAGATHRKRDSLHPPVPGAERTPGEWIARYIDRALQSPPEKVLNYVMLSHFHGDHSGFVDKNTKQSACGDYQASGLTEVADYIPFEKFIDRSWPDYDAPGGPGDSAQTKNLREFIDWQQKHKRMQVEQFNVGANDQIVLLNTPSKYPQFEIRNLAANGLIWTGQGSATRDHFKDANHKDISENKRSIAFRLAYGAFKYYSGGDLDSSGADTRPADLWRDIETPVAQACGPVHVAKANQHACHIANSIGFLHALRPRVIVIPTWHIRHASPIVWSRMHNKHVYPGPRDVLPTTMTKTTAQFISDDMKPVSGHIVVRVAPGGKEYTVYRITDSDESGEITSVHGPYQAE